jgi:predicted protein tyrosine phosphatase
LITLSDAHWASSAIISMEAEYLVSLMSPKDMVKTPSGIDPENHLKLEMDDIEAPVPGYICPSDGHIYQLLELGNQLDGGSEVVVHCLMGMSRSTAAVMILLTQQNPGREAEIAEIIFREVPKAHPNSLLLQLGDRALGCDGALASSILARPQATPKAQPIHSGALNSFACFPLYLDS